MKRLRRLIFRLQTITSYSALVAVSLMTVRPDLLVQKAGAFVIPSCVHSKHSTSALHYRDVSSDCPTPNNESSESSFTTSPHVRWQSPTLSKSAWQMQTAVTTFRQPTDDAVVELHAQLHFGEEDYYNFYNHPSFNEKHSAVCFELLVDEEMLMGQEKHRRVLRIPTATTSSSSHIQPSVVTASLSDQATAQQYGWTCQVNAMNYSQPQWFHADLTRQEFRQRLHKIKGASSPTTMSRQQQQPLWQQASSSLLPIFPSAFVTEAATALLAGPPFATDYLLLSSSSRHRRRLFTNLFLPGTALANVLRAALWMTVPSPELSILLLDWSSILLLPSSPQQEESNNFYYYNSKRLGVSPVSLSIPQLLWQGRFQAARQLLFGQVVLLGQHASATDVAGRGSGAGNRQDGQDLLIQQRNERAIQVVLAELMIMAGADVVPAATASSAAVTGTTTAATADNSINKTSPNAAKSVALLYGASHCPDLQKRLQAVGFVPIEQYWRTAWSVSVQNDREDPEQAALWSSPTTLFVAVLSLLYLVIGGLDWMSLWRSVWLESSSSSLQDAIMYLLRHVLLYVGLSKIVLDWKEPGDSL